MKSLLTTSNPKTLKGEAAGYYTALLHLAPADTAGVGNVCPAATAGCKAACLNTAGRGGIFKAGATTNPVQEARKRRTMLYQRSREWFEATLAHDIGRHIAQAKRLGLKPAIRINGTSDLPVLANRMATRFPDVPFYDYTKLRTWRMATQPANMHRTFSRSETNRDAVSEAFSRHVNVAIVFSTKRGAPLPRMWAGRKVIDGDMHDLRFLDPKGGVIVGLRAKGRARTDTTGFVVQEN